MGKGGRTTTQKVEQKIDPVLQASGQLLAPMAFQIAALGGAARNPYQGPTIAAPNAGMQSAMNATTQGGNAYGLGFQSPTANLPTPRDYGNGMVGYSPYQGARQAVRGLDPATRNQIDSFFGTMGQYAKAAEQINNRSAKKAGIGGKGGQTKNNSLDQIFNRFN